MNIDKLEDQAKANAGLTSWQCNVPADEVSALIAAYRKLQKEQTVPLSWLVKRDPSNDTYKIEEISDWKTVLAQILAVAIITNVVGGSMALWFWVAKYLR